MRSWSIPAGRLFGVDIRIHLTFVFLLAFVWFTQSVTMGTAGAMRGLALVGIIFGCVVLHELGHAVVARRNGVAVRSIILLPIGGVTLMEDVGQRNADPARDIRISAAGPVVNLVIAALSGAFILAFLPQVKLWAQPFVHANNLPRSFVLGKCVSRRLQSSAGLSHGWRPHPARVACRAHGLRARHPPRGRHRAGVRHAVDFPRSMEHLADADWLLPLRGRATGRPLGRFPVGAGERAHGRCDADRLLHAFARRHSGRRAAESGAHSARRLPRRARQRHDRGHQQAAYCAGAARGRQRICAVGHGAGLRNCASAATRWRRPSASWAGEDSA